MILSLGISPQPGALERAQKLLLELGMQYQVLHTPNATVIVVTSDADALPGHLFTQLDGIEKVVRLGNRSPLSRPGADGALGVTFGHGPAAVTVGGGAAPLIVAGPCSVESREHILETTAAVKTAGASALRGGAYKPRTSPYDFQGLGLEGLKYLREAGEAFQMPVISEVMSADQIAGAAQYVDVFQVGARNMYNYELLKELGRQPKPVLLKRAMSATVDELVQSAEYILSEGNPWVILCERGIRTFETRVRNTLDLSCVPVLRSLTNLPVMVDPSHAVGKRDFIRTMSRAAIACGADGLLLETHLVPAKSISDAAQAISPAVLSEIVKDAQVIYNALNPKITVQSGAISQ